MKKYFISLIIFPLVFSIPSYASPTFNSKSAGERALEERPLNPSPLKCNDPVSGSDGSDPDTVENHDR